MVPPADHPAHLSVRRAFVVQFRVDAVVEQAFLAGRVEHGVRAYRMTTARGQPQGIRDLDDPAALHEVSTFETCARPCIRVNTLQRLLGDRLSVRPAKRSLYMPHM